MGHALMTKSNPCLMIPTPHRIHIIHNQIPNLFSPFFHRFTSTSVTLGGSSIFVVKHIMDQYFCVRDRSTFYCVSKVHLNLPTQTFFSFDIESATYQKGFEKTYVGYLGKLCYRP